MEENLEWKKIKVRVIKCGNCGFPLLKKVTYQKTSSSYNLIREEYLILRREKGKTLEEKLILDLENFKGSGGLYIDCPNCGLKQAYRIIKITDEGRG